VGIRYQLEEEDGRGKDKGSTDSWIGLEVVADIAGGEERCGAVDEVEELGGPRRDRRGGSRLLNGPGKQNEEGEEETRCDNPMILVREARVELESFGKKISVLVDVVKDIVEVRDDCHNQDEV